MIKNAKTCSPTCSYSGSRPPETFLTTVKAFWLVHLRRTALFLQDLNSVVDRDVNIAPGRETGIDAVLIGVDGTALLDHPGDPGSDGGLLDIATALILSAPGCPALP